MLFFIRRIDFNLIQQGVLMTGTVRGQNLEETLDYIKRNLLEKGQCYTDSGKKQYGVMKAITRNIYIDLRREVMDGDL